MYGVGMSVRKVMRSSDRRIAATVASTLGSVGTAMCGICGMVGREDHALCWEMTRGMRHRGPARPLRARSRADAAPPQRDLRLRGMGRRAWRALPRARSARRQAALLRAGRRGPVLLLGGQG